MHALSSGTTSQTVKSKPCPRDLCVGHSRHPVHGHGPGGVEFLGLTPSKLGTFRTQDTYVPNTTFRVSPAQVLLGFQRVHYRSLLPRGIVGLLLLYPTGHRQEFAVLTGFVAIFSMTTPVLWGNARPRLPLHPLLAIAPAFALTIDYDLTEAWAGRNPRTQEEDATSETEARP